MHAHLAVRDAFLDFVASRTPAGRVGQPDEIASAALFLASNQGGFVTGIDLVIDGGFAQV